MLPPECLPCRQGKGKGEGGNGEGKGMGRKGGMVVAPALVARKRAVERERVKDGLRGWVGSVWRGEVGRREGEVRVW